MEISLAGLAIHFIEVPEINVFYQKLLQLKDGAY